MANRVFQNVVYQMKTAVDRVVGVVDETGAVIACSELGQIGEMREGFAAGRLNVLQFLTIRRYLMLVFSALVLLLLALAIWP